MAVAVADEGGDPRLHRRVGVAADSEAASGVFELEAAVEGGHQSRAQTHGDLRRAARAHRDCGLLASRVQPRVGPVGVDPGHAGDQLRVVGIRPEARHQDGWRCAATVERGSPHALAGEPRMHHGPDPGRPIDRGSVAGQARGESGSRLSRQRAQSRSPGAGGIERVIGRLDPVDQAAGSVVAQPLDRADPDTRVRRLGKRVAVGDDDRSQAEKRGKHRDAPRALALRTAPRGPRGTAR